MRRRGSKDGTGSSKDYCMFHESCMSLFDPILGGLDIFPPVLASSIVK